ncbi:NAD-dependent epimerase/dehydratase family protein [Halorubellus salinus]|uniref:NAD-dependent epimerase/dehydratase family protein n=1 Tax=Halorubellus salinus TaxID=755309 RepID=UPI001D0805C1|nr:NAD-dependent epimerase/dehydratase family protein [Halorubellus salinus]
MTHTTPTLDADSPLRGARILVTGGAGFIGSHLVDLLAPHADVHVLDDCSTGTESSVHDDATLTVGTITDRALVDELTETVDYVFHLAAIPSVPATLDAPTETLDVNATATAYLLERAAERDARLVFASSAAVYGRPSQLPIPETEPTTPRSPYGISKLAADQYVRGYADWYDCDAVALRFFNVYGPGQRDGVVPSFVARARAGEPLVVHGDGSQTRDFVHVSDVVRALVAAATTPATGQAFNVGTGTTTSVLELATLVSELAPETVPVVHDDSRPADIQESCADTTTARDELGFEAAVSLTDGLASLVGRTLAAD